MHEDLKLLVEAITALRLDILDAIQCTKKLKKKIEQNSSIPEIPDYFSDGKIQAYQEILQTLDRSGLTKIK